MCRIQLIIVIPAIIIFFNSKQAKAAIPWPHVSALMNYEVSEAYFPGFDINILFQNVWGVRYTFIPAVRFGRDSMFDSTNEELSLLNAEGDLNSTMVMRTIDYRSFPVGNVHPLDFLTAYIAIGYSDIPITVKKITYAAENSNLVKNSQSKQIASPVYTAAFGLYGGERLFVIDAHILYINGSIKDEKYLDSQIEFDHWLIVIGFGVGF